jgi:hypothetical protein
MPLALFVTDITCQLVGPSSFPGGSRRRGEV